MSWIAAIERAAPTWFLAKNDVLGQGCVWFGSVTFAMGSTIRTDLRVEEIHGM